MRTRDVVWLAVAALWQRKVRTVLTMLGVAVGCFVLITSLSIGIGVQRMLIEQLRKQDQLRRIIVWRTFGTPREQIPQEALEVKGEMSEARRKRLREALARRYQRTAQPLASGVRPEQVAELTRLEHVKSVTPGLNWMGKALLDGKTRPALIYTASAEDLGIARRVVTGRFFSHGQTGGVLVSEALAYGWGITDEKDVEKLLGRTARLEVAQPGPSIGGLLTLLNVMRPNLSPEDIRVLRTVLTRLPAALEKLDLPPDEQKVLLRLLGDAQPGKHRPIVQEQPIIGVFRDVERHEMGPWDTLPRPVDVLVPATVAEKMYFAVPIHKVLPQVTVHVDHEDNLRAVHDHITAMGLEAFSLAELVEQVRLTLLLVSIACAFVAVVALTVAGLGIANTMLTSVLQRTHEIGVMKAVGARDGHVLALFLMEGALTGATGALAGLLAGWLVSFPGDHIAAWLVARQTPMQLEDTVFAYPAWLILGVPLLVCLLATLAAVFPARRAARIDPIAALRQQ